MKLIINQLGKCTKGFWRLKDISYSCESGKVIGVIGNNGAGKTTLLSILSGLTDYKEGVIRIQDNNDIRDYDPNELAGSCISVNSGYKNMTGCEMLQYIALLNGITNTDEVNRLILCWDIPKHKKFSEYSLGMKVRLNIAMTMLKAPKILILDEVFNGLDPSGQKICKDNIMNYAREDRIVFVSSHSLLDISEIADEVIFMREGRIVRLLKDNFGVSSLKECFSIEFP